MQRGRAGEEEKDEEWDGGSAPCQPSSRWRTRHRKHRGPSGRERGGRGARRLRREGMAGPGLRGRGTGASPEGSGVRGRGVPGSAGRSRAEGMGTHGGPELRGGGLSWGAGPRGRGVSAGSGRCAGRGSPYAAAAAIALQRSPLSARGRRRAPPAMSDKMAAAAACPQPQPGPSPGPSPGLGPGPGPGPGPPAAEADRGAPRGSAADGEAEAEEFGCPAHCSDLAWRQNEQRRHGLYCDITLAFGGAGIAREYRAHRSVLAAATEYFTPLLSGGFAESRSGRVELQKWSSEGGPDPDTVEAVIGFMYTGTIRVSPGNVHEVLEMADR